MAKEYIEREALLARYDAEHVGSPGRARELIVTAPAADVVEVVRCENCVHYHPCQVELTDGSAPDWGICDQPWFNDDQNDVDEILLLRGCPCRSPPKEVTDELDKREG